MGFGKKDNLSQKDLYFKNDGINDKSRKRNYVLASIASILFIVFMFFNGVNLVKYVNAYVNYTTGNLDKSIVQFEELGDFLNAKYLVLDSKYLKAEKDFSKNPETSITVMNELNTDHGFKDSYSKYQQFVYEYASNSFEKGEYLKSAKWFNNSIGYKDSTAKVNESYYKLGKLYWEQKNYDSAITYIKLAGLANYKDSNALLSEYQYQYADRKSVV